MDFEAALLEVQASFMEKSTKIFMGSDLPAISLARLFASLLINGLRNPAGLLPALRALQSPHIADAIFKASQSQDTHAQASIVAIVLLNTFALVPYLKRVRRRPHYLDRHYRPSAQIRSSSNLSLAIHVLLPLAWRQVDFAIDIRPDMLSTWSSENLDRFVTWPAFSRLDIDEVDGPDALAVGANGRGRFQVQRPF
jgi:hypothetical protein